MATNLTLIAQTLRNIADQLEGVLPKPGGQHVNPAPRTIAMAGEPPAGYEAGIIKVAPKIKTDPNFNRGEPVLSLAVANNPDDPLRWLNVYNAQLMERVDLLRKGDRIHFQTKPSKDGGPGKVVTDIYQA